jgi:hypothetical protein
MGRGPLGTQSLYFSKFPGCLKKDSSHGPPCQYHLSLLIPFSSADRENNYSYGNHDSEDSDLTRLGQMRFMKRLPYYLGDEGPAEVDGVGNYMLGVQSNDP